MGRRSTAASCLVKTPGEGGQARLKNGENSNPFANFSLPALKHLWLQSALSARCQRRKQLMRPAQESTRALPPTYQHRRARDSKGHRVSLATACSLLLPPPASSISSVSSHAMKLTLFWLPSPATHSTAQPTLDKKN